MANNLYKFLIEGYADSGARISPCPIEKIGSSAAEARQKARKTFKDSKGPVITSCKNITKKK